MQFKQTYRIYLVLLLLLFGQAGAWLHSFQHLHPIDKACSSKRIKHYHSGPEEQCSFSILLKHQILAVYQNFLKLVVLNFVYHPTKASIKNQLFCTNQHVYKTRGPPILNQIIID